MFKWLIGRMIYIFEPVDKRKVDFFDQPIAKRKPRTQVKRVIAKKAPVKKPAVKKTTTTKAKK